MAPDAERRERGLTDEVVEAMFDDRESGALGQSGLVRYKSRERASAF
jgi:hypothetical protein